MQGCSLLGARSTARPPQQGASVTVPSRRHAALVMARSASLPSAPGADKQAAGDSDEKDECDRSDASGSSRAVRSAYIAPSIPRQSLVIVCGQGAGLLWRL